MHLGNAKSLVAEEVGPEIAAVPTKLFSPSLPPPLPPPPYFLVAFECRPTVMRGGPHFSVQLSIEEICQTCFIAPRLTPFFCPRVGVALAHMSVQLAAALRMTSARLHGLLARCLAPATTSAAGGEATSTTAVSPSTTSPLPPSLSQEPAPPPSAMYALAPVESTVRAAQLAARIAQDEARLLHKVVGTLGEASRADTERRSLGAQCWQLATAEATDAAAEAAAAAVAAVFEAAAGRFEDGVVAAEAEVEAEKQETEAIDGVEAGAGSADVEIATADGSEGSGGVGVVVRGEEAAEEGEAGQARVEEAAVGEAEEGAGEEGAAPGVGTPKVGLPPAPPIPPPQARLPGSVENSSDATVAREAEMRQQVAEANAGVDEAGAIDVVGGDIEELPSAAITGRLPRSPGLVTAPPVAEGITSTNGECSEAAEASGAADVDDGPALPSTAIRALPPDDDISGEGSPAASGHAGEGAGSGGGAANEQQYGVGGEFDDPSDSPSGINLTAGEAGTASASLPAYTISPQQPPQGDTPAAPADVQPHGRHRRGEVRRAHLAPPPPPADEDDDAVLCGDSDAALLVSSAGSASPSLSSAEPNAEAMHGLPPPEARLSADEAQSADRGRRHHRQAVAIADVGKKEGEAGGEGAESGGDGGSLLGEAEAEDGTLSLGQLAATDPQARQR